MVSCVYVLSDCLSVCLCVLFSVLYGCVHEINRSFVRILYVNRNWSVLSTRSYVQNVN